MSVDPVPQNNPAVYVALTAKPLEDGGLIARHPRVVGNSYLFFFSRSRDHRDLHSFPTRRSSDLCEGAAAAMARRSTKTPPPDDSYEEKILDIDVVDEMQGSFLEYAYSVIYSRALPDARDGLKRSEEHTSELQSHVNLVCRLLLEK